MMNLTKTCVQALPNFRAPVRLAIATLIFGCGGDEGLPPDVTDINDIPCPSCMRMMDPDTQDTQENEAVIPQSEESQATRQPTTDEAEPPMESDADAESASGNGSSTTGSDEITTPAEDLPGADGQAASIPLTFRFNDADSLLYVQVFKDETRLFSSFSHNHVMRATGWATEFFFDANDLTTCRVSATVPVENLRVDETAMRALVQQSYTDARGQTIPGSPDYNQPLSDSDREQIRNSMLSVSQLNSLVYPDITLESSDCSGMVGTSGEVSLPATMTLKGVPSQVNLELRYDFSSPNQALISGKIRTTHANLGFEPYSDLGGAVANAQPLEFTFDLSGQADSN